MKIHHQLRAIIFGAALAAFAVLPACTTVQVTDDTIGEFRINELQTVVEGRFADAYEATLAAIEDQGLFLTGDRKKVVEAVVTARDRADTEVTIKLKEIAEGRTSVKIRYGLTGDAARSQILYRAIEERL